MHIVTIFQLDTHNYEVLNCIINYLKSFVDGYFYIFYFIIIIIIIIII
jgi:hypothetical protein